MPQRGVTFIWPERITVPTNIFPVNWGETTNFDIRPWSLGSILECNVDINVSQPPGYYPLTLLANTGTLDNDGVWTPDGRWNIKQVITRESSKTIKLTVPLVAGMNGFCITVRFESAIVNIGPIVKEETQYFRANVWTCLGEFALEYVPVSIVYSPPGQDMTAAVSATKTNRTRFTFTTSTSVTEEFGSETRTNNGWKIGGVGVGTTDTDITSNSIANTATQAVSIGYDESWSTSFIADNRTTIGRKYWGPLGDLFVLARNLIFAVYSTAENKNIVVVSDRTKNESSMIVVPAHKLLRPEGDPVAEGIPPWTRRSLLEFDPFIKNLDRFFPKDLQGEKESNLEVAVDPYANPSVHGAGCRAYKIGRYSLSTGAVFDLSSENSIVLSDTQTNEQTFAAMVSRGFTVDTDLMVEMAKMVDIGVDITNTEWSSKKVSITIQNSRETGQSVSSSATCHLVRNQNQADLEDIEIWYDKIFSSLMFRKVKPGPHAIVVGRVLDRGNLPLKGVRVELLDNLGAIFASMTDQLGRYEISNVEPGKAYALQCGDKLGNAAVKVQIKEGGGYYRQDLKEVRRVVDIRKVARWELKEILGNVSQKDLLSVQQELRKVKIWNKVNVDRALSKVNLSIDKLKDRVDIKMPSA